MEYVLETNAIGKSYGHFKALSALSMHVPKGSIYGFVGKNGAGKTTLIRLICGLQDPSSGSYTLYGIRNDEKEIISSRRRLGAIVETPSIYMNMTAEENMKQQYRILGIPSLDGIRDTLKLVNLADTGKKKAGNFSLGMRQRLGLAIALVGDPEFIILDEPTIGLDPLGVMELRQLVLKLNQERNMTILFSSHNLAEMAQVATRYGFLHKGKLLEVISAQEAGAACQERGINLETYFVELLLSQREAERHGEAV